MTSYQVATDFNVNRVAQVDVYAGAPAPPPDLSGFTGCTGSASTLVTSTRHEYDNTPASITRGDLTRSFQAILNASPSWLRVRDIAYRADGLPISSTDARGYVTSVLAFDPVLDMYPAHIRNAIGLDETREYQPHFGKVSTERDANGSARSISYDGFGRKQGVHTPLSLGLGVTATTWIYGDGFPNWTATIAPYQTTSATTAVGAAVEFRDGLGRAFASVRDGDSMQERVIGRRIAYWTATKMPATIVPPAEVAVAACDSTSTCLASWARTTPALINWQTLTGTSGGPARFSYDPLGRVVRRDNPDGSLVAYAHTVDALGFGTQELDEVGDQRRIYRDARGDIARVERWASPAGPPAITRYDHDPRRKLTRMTSPLGAITSLAWNSLGLLERVSSPEVGALDFAYDADGHEVMRNDGRGLATSTFVDGLGRPTMRTTSAGELELWAYDRDPMCVFSCGAPPPAADNTLGRPWATLDASGFATFAYDRDGHLARDTRYVESHTLTTGYVNWPTGQVVRKTFPDGETHRFAMAPDGQPVALFVGGDPTPTVELTRDAMGRPADILYASGAAMHYAVNPLTQRIDNIKTTDADHVVVQELAYDYRPDGLVETVHRSDALSGSEDSFITHDGLKRVIDVYVVPDTTSPAEHYEYDADNRMTARKDRGSATLAVSHADPAHPNAVTGLGTRAFAHDGAGNRIEERDGVAVTRTLDYDGHGRLASVDGGATSYVYDADGHRIIERLPAGPRIVVGGYTREPDGSSGTLLQLGATRLGERVGDPKSARNRFFHTDGVGSVIGETDHGGSFDTSRSFSAFGVAIAEHGAGSRFGFGGYSLDDVTGLSFASSRYYDASTASFTQGDTWLYGFDSPEALNGYAYAANSPYQYADPSGHFLVPLLVAAGITFVVGMAIDYARSDGDPDWGYIIVRIWSSQRSAPERPTA